MLDLPNLHKKVLHLCRLYGDWTWATSNSFRRLVGRDHCELLFGVSYEDGQYSIDGADTVVDYIADFDPPLVRQLIERLQELEKTVETCRAYFRWPVMQHLQEATAAVHEATDLPATVTPDFMKGHEIAVEKECDQLRAKLKTEESLKLYYHDRAQKLESRVAELENPQDAPGCPELDLDELERVAEDGTPSCNCACGRQTCICGERKAKRDKYLATFDPSTVTRMIASAKKLEARVAYLEKTQDAAIWAEPRAHEAREEICSDLEAQTEEVNRLNAILSGDESDLLSKWMAQDGPEAHAVHLAAVEHESEICQLEVQLEARTEQLEAWRDTAEKFNLAWEAFGTTSDSVFDYGAEADIALFHARALDKATETASEPRKLSASSSMRIVVIESPFAGKGATAQERQADMECNLRYCRAAMKDCLLRGEAPYASHALYTQEGVLDDDIPEQRDHGIQAGFAFRAIANTTVVYTDLGMSSGMKYGINHALEGDRPVEYRTLLEWSTHSSTLNKALNPPPITKTTKDLAVKLDRIPKEIREMSGVPAKISKDIERP